MKIISHRGAKGLAPENTLKGLEKALEHNVDEIEFDVRVTRDGKTALLHDPFVLDRAGNKLEVISCTFDELQLHKPDLTGLEEAIMFVDRKVPLLIEIKPKVPAAQTIAILKEFLSKGWVPSDFRVASFEQGILTEVHRAIPDLPLVVNEHWSGVLATYRAHRLGTKRLNMRSWWLWRGFLAPMHRRGWEIAPYTINDVQLAKKWQPYLYGIITDFPDQFEK